MRPWLTHQQDGHDGIPLSCLRRRDFGVLALCAGLSPLPVVARGVRREAAPTPAALQRGQHEFEALAACALRLELRERVGFVNARVNQCVEPQPDALDHDDWATPFETLARGAGDCEDSAIAKFFLLRASGVPLAQLRLVYAWHERPEAPALRRAHMVAVARRPFEDPWVLDSINLLVVPLSLRDDLVPVFSFDERWLWPRIDGQPWPPQRGELAPWRGLLLRWQAQLH